MSSSADIFPFPPSATNGSDTVGPDGRQDSFSLCRQRVTQCLLRHTLLKSYRQFQEAGIAYPFISSDRVFPETDRRAAEMRLQNTALVVMLDGNLPVSLRKHFRERQSNKVTWRNLQRLLPGEDHEAFKAAHCRVDADEFEDLLITLLKTDYALILEREKDGTIPALTHMHVKVERLTDNGIRDLAKQLGYIDRSLFERGEDYVEELEAKFFEYFAFSANASGRKSAAALAAQLLAKTGQRYSVYVASQTDNRLTHLSDRDFINQYFLGLLTPDQVAELRERAGEQGETDLRNYLIDEMLDGHAVACLRVQYRRTAAAQPTDRRSKQNDIHAPWISLSHQSVVSLDRDKPSIAIRWADAVAVGNP